MAKCSEAEAAIKALQGSDLEGRRLKVLVAWHKRELLGNARSRDVYVGNLGADPDHDSLLRLFAQHGLLLRINMPDDEATGASKGYAFVTFSSEAEADAAAAALDGADFEGRPIKVAKSEKPKPEPRAAKRAVEHTQKLFVSNLVSSFTEEELHDMIAEEGDVMHVSLPMDPATGNCRGFGFATCATAEDAARVVTALDGAEVRGKTLRVSIARPRGPRLQEAYDESW
ncbi:hypothetical protein JKP88DRAFT_189941 [Tribonema minus]|uniref:RRM domain-containing protein n=1 Tax=Tribonema minus TaxID=303371 RepID=A0A835YIZ3_9STRA|nr:hypothetical protein JKP88DRAFT_189941 [Tribonema minus]